MSNWVRVRETTRPRPRLHEAVAKRLRGEGKKAKAKRLRGQKAKRLRQKG